MPGRLVDLGPMIEAVYQVDGRSMKNKSPEPTPDPPFHEFNHPPTPGNAEVNKELMAADGSAVVGRRCALSAPMAALMGTFAAARFSYVWISL